MFSRQTRILIVDDFASMRKVTIQILEQLGYSNFIEADDGHVAWNAIVNIQPQIQLVICDWNMPGETGLDLLKKMRGRDTLKDIPFIMSTTRSEKESVMQAIEHGASHFIIKPFTKEVFEKRLEAVFNKMPQKKTSPF